MNRSRHGRWAGWPVTLAVAAMLIATGFSTGMRAAPLAHDLGQGLHYLRPAALPDDLPDAAGAHVLDLRFARADAPGAGAFSTWLRKRAKPPPPASPASVLLVLVNAETSPELLRVLQAQSGPKRVLTLGRPAPDYTPDIVVPVSAEQEQAAFAALAEGRPPQALLTENADKPRLDEASLMRELRDAPPAEEELELADEPGLPARAEPAAAPLIDRTLQRAVQIHRGLLAAPALP